MTVFIRIAAQFVMTALLAASSLPALAQGEPIGIVIMHGKGGSPERIVSDLARSLEAKGCLVANLEMPWSGRRNYDVPVSRAEEEIETALAQLRAKGARKLFVAGHSQGGGFALHVAGKHAVDGIIAIAPGGSVSSPLFREKLGESVARARKLVAEGRGGEPERLEDYEGSRGAYAIVTTPAAYVTWFEPDGAMNFTRAARAASPRVPILFIIPRRDYPGLLKSSPGVFRLLPANPLTRLYEPDSDHLHAPGASAEEIARWTREVAGAPNR